MKATCTLPASVPSIADVKSSILPDPSAQQRLSWANHNMKYNNLDMQYLITKSNKHPCNTNQPIVDTKNGITSPRTFENKNVSSIAEPFTQNQSTPRPE